MAQKAIAHIESEAVDLVRDLRMGERPSRAVVMRIEDLAVERRAVCRRVEVEVEGVAVRVFRSGEIVEGVVLLSFRLMGKRREPEDDWREWPLRGVGAEEGYEEVVVFVLFVVNEVFVEVIRRPRP